MDTFIWTDARGITWDFTDPTKWLFKPPDGFGLPDLEIVERQTPFGDGAQWVYTRLKPRDFTLTVVMRAPDWSTAQDRRDYITAAFSTAPGPGTLTVFRANGTARALVCTPKTGLKFNAANQKGMNRLEPITFHASDPSWYDPGVATATTTTWSASGGAFGTFPIALGSSNSPLVWQLPNNGNLPTYPVFVIGAGAVNPVVWNKTARRYLRWNGTVAPGTTLTFDCAFFNPLVTITDTNGATYSGFGQLDATAKFFALDGGVVSTIAYTQDNRSVPVTVTYAYKHRYSGI